MIPNILTLIGLCAGLTSVRFGLDGHFGAAAVAITFAGCIDGLDGRLARLLRAVSRFGAEFDSLADFMGFGVAPAFLLYLWSMQRLGPFGFVPCMFFAVCVALRLARFNAALDAGPSPAYAYNFFTGVPAPAGAGLTLLPIFLGLEGRALDVAWLVSVARSPALCAPVLIGSGLLCVSTLPVWSFKNFKVPAEYVLPVLLGVGVFAAVLVADPWAALVGLGRGLYHHAAVQRAQLPPPAARGRAGTGRSRSLTSHDRAPPHATADPDEQQRAQNRQRADPHQRGVGADSGDGVADQCDQRRAEAERDAVDQP